MLLQIAGLLIVVALVWYALKVAAPHVPAILVQILQVALVIVAVVVLCGMLGVPLPGISR